MHPLDLARPNQTHLVAIHFEGAYRLPLFLSEINPMLTLGPNTFHQLDPIVPSYLYLCVLVFSFVQFTLYLFYLLCL